MRTLLDLRSLTFRFTSTKLRLDQFLRLADQVDFDGNALQARKQAIKLVSQPFRVTIAEIALKAAGDKPFPEFGERLTCNRRLADCPMRNCHLWTFLPLGRFVWVIQAPTCNHLRSGRRGPWVASFFVWGLSSVPVSHSPFTLHCGMAHRTCLSSWSRILLRRTTSASAFFLVAGSDRSDFSSLAIAWSISCLL